MAGNDSTHDPDWNAEDERRLADLDRRIAAGELIPHEQVMEKLRRRAAQSAVADDAAPYKPKS
jgi:hypothetical protein